jgi:hypothetical protein
MGVEMAEKKVIDWDAMEPEWRAGITSKQQLSESFGVSRAAIDKHWAKAGIGRDLTAQIRAKADALVTQDAVTREVTAATKIQEKELVEANATLQATVRREQRKDIQRSRKLVMSLLSELEHQTDNMDLLKQLGELMLNPDDKGVDKLNELYQKMISLSSRTGTMKSLADSLKSLVALEREAFGIDGKDEDTDNGNPVVADPQDLARRIAFLLAQSIHKGT